MKALEEAWLSHVPEFPFMMGVGLPPRQFIVHTKEEFIMQVYLNLNTDIFTSVHSVEKRRNDIFHWIYFDIDRDKELDFGVEELNRSYLDTCRLYEWLKEKEYDCRVYFSGNKGFNVYIDFPSEVIIDDYSDRIRSLVLHFEKQLRIKRIDMGVVVDKNRISRLPYTKNTKSGKLCVPINLQTFDLTSLKARISPLNFVRDRSVNSEKNFGKGLLKLPYEKQKNTYSTEPTSNIETTLFYVISKAKHISSGSRHAAVWKIIIPTMLRLGYSDDDISKTSIDFLSTSNALLSSDKSWIKSQIRMTKKKQIHPMRWEKFKYEFNVKV